MSADAATGAPALPPPYEFAAPPQWRAIDFISDLHLSEALPRTFDAWASHLRDTGADAVFLLGDIFELWVGDDARRLPFQQRCVDVMADAASRRTLAFMAGNRDFLVGTEMLRDCGLMGLSDPTVLDAWGRRVLLSHGDILCLDDAPYQVFRAMVRSPDWQRDFLAKPLAERLAMAAAVRQQSRVKGFDGNADADLDHAAMVAWMHASGAAELVHGHTHRPGSELLAPGHKRHVLTDWDLDDAARPRAEVLRLTRDGFERIAPG